MIISKKTRYIQVASQDTERNNLGGPARPYKKQKKRLRISGS